MKLSSAYVCYSCQEVMNGAPQGKCPACSSGDVFPLGWLDRPREERSRWLNRIRGKVTRTGQDKLGVLSRAA